MANDPYANRRSSSRYDVRLSAEVSYGSSTITTRTRNVSVGGVCLETDVMMPEGTVLNVALFLVTDDVEDPQLPQLQVKGSIAWVKDAEDDSPALVGVKFERISAQQVAHLTRFLKLTGGG